MRLTEPGSRECPGAGSVLVHSTGHLCTPVCTCPRHSMAGAEPRAPGLRPRRAGDLWDYHSPPAQPDAGSGAKHLLHETSKRATDQTGGPAGLDAADASLLRGPVAKRADPQALVVVMRARDAPDTMHGGTETWRVWCTPH